MIIPGEIEKRGSIFAAMLEPLGAYGQGKSRRSAIAALAAAIAEHAADYGPLEGFKVTITEDGASTLYVTANDPARLLSLLLRRQRELNDLSLAKVTSAMGAKSRNGWAQYEHGSCEPSIRKLQEMLSVVAPDLTVAIIPRTAQVLPRYDDVDEADEIERMIADPSSRNVEALHSKLAVRRSQARTRRVARRPARSRRAA